MTDFYEIETRLGTMIVGLYDQTPRHRDNFRTLVEEGFYNGTSFHRVIAGFMAQGGDPNSKDDDPMNDGQGGPGYTIEAEFRDGLFHRKGALSAAR
ncbi:MAG: peptidylprolyl isomerase, partial [Bacteroidetes bacterium CG12_big_fil_rev_8_21_14_0_65_60_17]